MARLHVQPALHTNCGKRCEQGRLSDPKHLKSKGKAQRAQIICRSVSGSPSWDVKRLQRQGWYSPIPDKQGAGSLSAVDTKARLSSTSLLFFTNFVEKIVSKDLDQD